MCSIWVVLNEFASCECWVKKVRILIKISDPNQGKPNQSKPNQSMPDQSNGNFLKSSRAPWNYFFWTWRPLSYTTNIQPTNRNESWGCTCHFWSFFFLKNSLTVFCSISRKMIWCSERSSTVQWWWSISSSSSGHNKQVSHLLCLCDYFMWNKPIIHQTCHLLDILFRHHNPHTSEKRHSPKEFLQRSSFESELKSAKWNKIKNITDWCQSCIGPQSSFSFTWKINDQIQCWPHPMLVISLTDKRINTMLVTSKVSQLGIHFWKVQEQTHFPFSLCRMNAADCSIL